MLIAELEGKIPSKLKNSEDLLTSFVFGILKYLSSPFYLQSILQGSFNSTGSNLNFDKELTLCNYVFWPRLNTSEPDLLLHLMDMGGSEYIICIEANIILENLARRIYLLKSKIETIVSAIN